MKSLSPESFFFQNNLFEEGKVIGGFLCEVDSEENALKGFFQSSFPEATVLRIFQVHGNDIASLLSTESISDFLSQPREDRHYDGLITDQEKHILVIRTADCVPILFYSKNRPLIGGIHCGWRSLAQGIIKVLFATIPEGIRNELRFLIGPAICQNCYEVGEEVIIKFQDVLPDFSSVVRGYSEKKSFLDLKGLSRLLLIQEGVKDTAISVNETCTRCHPAFHSHRENQTRERNINFITFVKSGTTFDR